MEGSWEQYSKHVLEELKRLNKNIEDLNNSYQADRLNTWTEITALKIKAGVWGLVGGALAVVPSLIFIYLENY